MYAAPHGIERVGAGAPQVIFTRVSGVMGSIGSKKTQIISRFAAARCIS